MKKQARLSIAVIAISLFLAGCSSIDCPLNNVVYAKYKLAGQTTTLTDTLTISTARSIDGSDTVLINRQEKTDSFSLPMSYQGAQDVFYIETRSTDRQVYHDTLTVSKQDQPHFESVDCTPNYFHTITGVACTHNTIDSIVIKQRNVTYDASQTHFLIYFKLHD